MRVPSEDIDEREATLSTSSVRGSFGDSDFSGVRVSELDDLIKGRGSLTGMRRGDAGESP